MASASSAPAGKRLMNELANYRKEPNPCLQSLEPDSDDDLLHWGAVMKGVEGTPYEGGFWKIDIKIPDNYPHAPPVMKFMTKICHPNIHLTSGEICLDLLTTAWSGICTLSLTLTAIHQLLTSPAPDSPLNVDAAAVLKSGDLVGYESLVRLWTVMYAGRPPTFG